MCSEHDAISVQLCLHAGLTAEAAEALLDRLAERAPFSKRVIDAQAAEIARLREVLSYAETTLEQCERNGVLPYALELALPDIRAALNEQKRGDDDAQHN